MTYFRAAKDRGSVAISWLKSRHSFSFGHYYDPKHMGFSVLRVINEDRVTPGGGFAPHGHENMEIISIVLEGALEHADTMGNKQRIPAGEVQLMSAGTGVRHSEYNASASEPVRFLQIWIQPNRTGVEPSYQQKAIDPTGPVTPLVTPDGEQGSLTIHQDASLSRISLTAGDSLTLQPCRRNGYLHVISGTVETPHGRLSDGDALGISADETLPLEVGTGSLDALWFDLP